jgi:hypothetical protein
MKKAPKRIICSARRHAERDGGDQAPAERRVVGGARAKNTDGALAESPDRVALDRVGVRQPLVVAAPSPGMTRRTCRWRWRTTEASAEVWRTPATRHRPRPRHLGDARPLDGQVRAPGYVEPDRHRHGPIPSQRKSWPNVYWTRVGSRPIVASQRPGRRPQPRVALRSARPRR